MGSISTDRIRKRRVKCDEEKPECRRCVAGGRECEGYEVTSQRQATHAVRRLLLPGPRHGSPTSFSSTSRLPSPVSSLPGVDSDEARYFDHFCKYTAPCLAGPFASPLFERFVAQLGHREPLIRHAATALAALQIAQDHNGRIVLNQEEAGFALKQYGKSLALMTTMIPPTTLETQRLSLVACALFVVFETAQKRFAETAMHLNQGLNLLIHVRHKGSLPQEWELAEFDNSDEGAALDGEIVRTFDRLDIQSAYFRSARPKLPSDPLKAARQTPTRFTTLEQAREFLSAFLRSMCDFRQEVRATPSPYTSQDTSRLEGLQIKIQQQLQAWKSAFAPFRLTELHLPFDATPPSDASGRATLEAMATSCGILIDTGISDGREIVFDAYYPEFKLIVDLAEVCRDHPRFLPQYSSSPNDGSGFRIHMSVIPSVYTVALKCRDPYIRRRAITLLGGLTFREGLWDGPMGSQLTQHICELEESGFEGLISATDLPERARLHEVLFDLSDREGGVKAKYKRRDFEGEVGEPGAWIEWTDRADVCIPTLEVTY